MIMNLIVKKVGKGSNKGDEEGSGNFIMTRILDKDKGLDTKVLTTLLNVAGNI